MESSLSIVLAALLVATLGALQPAVVVAGVAVADTRRRRTGILWSAVIAVGGGLLLAVLASVARSLPVVSSGVAPAFLLSGLLVALVTTGLLLARPGSGPTVRVLGTIAAIVVGAGHVLDSGPALFGLSRSAVVVLVGMVLGAVVLLAVAAGLSAAVRRWRSVEVAVLVATVAAAVTGIVQVVLHLLHRVLSHVPALSTAVSLGVTLLVGVVALLIRLVVGQGRPVRD